MRQRAFMRIAAVGIFAALAPCTILAQTQSARPLTLVTQTEHAALQNLVLRDARVRALVGEGTPRVLVSSEAVVDKAEAERFINGQSTTPPTRRTSVLLFNAATNRAARAIVGIGASRIENVEQINLSDVPLSAEDADEALTLAKQNPQVRKALGASADAYRIDQNAENANGAFLAQVLPVRSSDPNDSCYADRCLDLIFRNQSGYLPIAAHVDLTKRSVAPEAAR